MIKAKEKEKLTPELILSRVSEDEIYRKYFQSFKLGKIYNSPFRRDSSPSFSIKNISGVLRHMDFGKKEFSGNCFNFVMQLFNLNFPEALDKINLDMGIQGSLSVAKPTVYKASSKTDIKIVARNFTEDELHYWKIMGISKEDLIKESIFSIEKLYINNYLIPENNELKFAYLFIDEFGHEYIKVYTPYSKDKGRKFITNVPGNLLSGWDKVNKGGESVIITKSKKDEVILSRYLGTTCSLQNESIRSLPDYQIKHLLENYKFSYILFDPDEAGLACTEYYEKLGFKPLELPTRYKQEGIKDIADLSSYYGIDAVRYFLNKNNII